ncbi:restriction endonuclease subunit S [Nocardia farcinica]|uniref:restriction endonuclease subunit S n=1 Tax=Nocardia farcinica TaxID=37329 RepID=UPI002455A7F1|nr:restriction endonuclease subunit S [Nocardia farcinica]
MTAGTTWPTVPLKEVADVRLGRQLSPKNRTGENMRPYLRAANVTWRGLALDDVKTMNFTETEAETFMLRPGDILVGEASGSAAEVGKPAMWTGEIADCCFQNTLIRVRSHSIDPRYLLHFLRHEARRGALVEHARGVGIHHIGAARLGQWQVPLPPLEEQQRIADLMDKAEELANRIEDNLRQAVSSHDKAVDAMIYGALFGPPSDDLLPHDASTQDEAPLPIGWAWRALGEIADVASGITKDSKKQSDPEIPEYPYLRVANVQRNKLDLTDVARIRVQPERAAQLTLRPGDVLMNEGGDRDKLGRGWVWEGQIDNCIHQNHVFRVRVKDEILDPRLLSWYGNTYARRWFESRGKQNTRLASISMKLLRQLPVPVPPREAQAEIVKEIEGCLLALDSLRARVRMELDNLRRLRIALATNVYAGFEVESVN